MNRRDRLFSRDGSSASQDAMSEFRKATARPVRRSVPPVEKASLPKLSLDLARALEALPSDEVQPETREAVPVVRSSEVLEDRSLLDKVRRFAGPLLLAAGISGTVGTSVLCAGSILSADKVESSSGSFDRPTWPHPTNTDTPDPSAPSVPETATPEAKKPEAASGDGKIIEANTSNFDQIIENATTPVVVDFYATWCGPCKMAAPMMERAAKENAGKVLFIKVDVDLSPEVASKYGVNLLPTFITFKGGVEVHRQEGLPPESELKTYFKTLSK